MPAYPPGYLDEYCGGPLLGASITFIILNIAFVGLRFAARRESKALPGWDDYFVLPALAVNLALDVADIVLVPVGGAGRHVEFWLINDPSKIEKWAKVLLATETLYIVAVTLSKLAILGIYARILTSRRLLNITYGLAAIVVAAGLGSTLATIFQCIPIAFQWDKSIEGGQCFDIPSFFRYNNLPNIITDVVMLVLPWPMVWSLKLPRTQKIGVASVFLTGGLGLAASCVRFAIVLYQPLTDGTWQAAVLNIWSLVEAGVYLIICCLPLLRKIVISWLRSLHILRTSDMSGRQARGSRRDNQRYSKSDGELPNGVGFKRLPEGASGSNDDQSLVHAYALELMDMVRPSKTAGGGEITPADCGDLESQT